MIQTEVNTNFIIGTIQTTIVKINAYYDVDTNSFTLIGGGGEDVVSADDGTTLIEGNE